MSSKYQTNQGQAFSLSLPKVKIVSSRMSVLPYLGEKETYCGAIPIKCHGILYDQSRTITITGISRMLAVQK